MIPAQVSTDFSAQEVCSVADIGILTSLMSRRDSRASAFDAMATVAL